LPVIKKTTSNRESLGTNCSACHAEKSWKEVGKFNHEKTDFPLLGKHSKVECKECHKSQMFKDASKECYACHAKDDKHKGNLGKSCKDCHSENDWKGAANQFQHDLTKFPLRNAHARATIKCDACHKDLESFRNTSLSCFSCHQKDDKHSAQLGAKCESCHNDRGWKGTSFNHGQSIFPLTGKHLVTDCSKCHATLRYKDTPSQCYSCHKNDDRHKLVFGVECQACHNARSWTSWSFDHGTRTKFALLGRHAKLVCESCHKAPAPPKRTTAPIGDACVACHKAEDVHSGAFGTRCEQCHSSESWKKVKSSLIPRVEK